jgi:hypothetical protein
MAFTMELRLPRDAAPMYAQLNRVMGMTEDSLPWGLLHHFATETDESFSVFDVWESREAYDQFFEGRLGPAMREVAGDRAGEAHPVFGELRNEFHAT